MLVLLVEEMDLSFIKPNARFSGNFGFFNDLNALFLLKWFEVFIFKINSYKTRRLPHFLIHFEAKYDNSTTIVLNKVYKNIECMW